MLLFISSCCWPWRTVLIRAASLCYCCCCCCSLSGSVIVLAWSTTPRLHDPPPRPRRRLSASAAARRSPLAARCPWCSRSVFPYYYCTVRSCSCSPSLAARSLLVRSLVGRKEAQSRLKSQILDFGTGRCVLNPKPKPKYLVPILEDNH